MLATEHGRAAAVTGGNRGDAIARTGPGGVPSCSYATLPPASKTR
jgi:hypothetical protein